MNIEMHGLPDDEQLVCKIGEAIWRQIIVTLPPEVNKNCVVTNVPSRSFNREGKRVSFLRVYSDQVSDFEVACKLLKPIHLPGGVSKKFIEFVLLADCASV